MELEHAEFEISFKLKINMEISSIRCSILLIGKSQ